MTTIELAKKLNIHYKKIQRKTKKAIENNIYQIKLEDRFFKFEKVSGKYRYKELFGEVINTNDTDMSNVWRKASEEQQRLASRRLSLIRAYRNRPSGESWKNFLKRVEHKYKDIKPTKSKLFRWLETVRRCEEKGEVPLEHLLDLRGKNGSNRSYSDEQYKFVARLFLENPDRSLRRIHSFLKEEYGDSSPSYATVARMVKRYKKENILVATLAKSPQEANNKLRPAPGNASESAQYNNAIWEMDGTPADVMCADGVRYQLSAAIDVYSRRAIVVVTPTANSSALSKVFKKGIQKLGVPEKVRIDNGREYKSLAFEYVCARLGVEQQFTEPYSGWQKPHIERFFGTLTRDLFEELPGYTGHNVEDRRRIEDRKTYEKKLEAKARAKEILKHGNAAAKRLARKQQRMDIYIPTTLTRDELELYIDKWMERYERRTHRGIRQTPMERWNECPVPVRSISDERVLDVLVGLSVKKRITKKGITWKKISYWHDIFYDKVGESVWVLSDDDLGYIYVYDMQMKFLCRAENAEHIGKSRADYMASRFFDKKSKKIIRELNELRRESPQRYRMLVDDVSKKNDLTVGVDIVNETIEGVRAVVSTESDKKSDHERVTINGRPIFGSVSERFEWDLAHGTVDETTRKLARKHEGLWKIALEAHDAKKAG